LVNHCEGWKISEAIFRACLGYGGIGIDRAEDNGDSAATEEIELTDADQKLTLPDWIGAEVTADPTYRKINMVAAARVPKPSSLDDERPIARADEVIE
jgi:CYTH domain-containing protein